MEIFFFKNKNAPATELMAFYNYYNERGWKFQRGGESLDTFKMVKEAALNWKVKGEYPENFPNFFMKVWKHIYYNYLPQYLKYDAVRITYKGKEPCKSISLYSSPALKKWIEENGETIKEAVSVFTKGSYAIYAYNNPSHNEKQ